jgi:CYTH domain-containing protein
VFSIDVFDGELEELVLCETEAQGLEGLMSAEPPSYATHEVTEDRFFEGGSLCRTTRAELMLKLSMLESVSYPLKT